MGSAQSINKCLRKTNAGPSSTEVSTESRAPMQGTAASVSHLWSLLREWEGKEKAAPRLSLSLTRSPLSKQSHHVISLPTRQAVRRLSLQKGQLYHRADVGIQLEGVLGEKALVGVVSCKLQRPQLEFR